MIPSQTYQGDPKNVYPIYAAKLETQAELLKKAAQLDIETAALQAKLIWQTDKTNYLNKVLIPKRDQMYNDIKSSHKAWLKFLHDNDDKRQRLITLHQEKMRKLQPEEMQLKNHISDKDIEARQLQAKIAELKAFKSQQQQIKEETAKIRALKLQADEQKTNLQESVQNIEQIIATKKLQFNRSGDELQKLKLELANVEDDNTKIAATLINMRVTQESLASVKLQSEFEIKHYEEELAVVAATHSADEVAMTSTMMTLQTEKAKLLDEQSAQQLQNDAIILNLDNELRKIKQLSGYANDMEVIDMSNPGRNSTQQFRNKNYNSMNCIVQLPNHADIPNNEFRIRTHQSVVNNVEVINLVSPVRNSTQQYPNETHNTNNVTLQNDAVIPSNEYLVPTPQNYIIGVEAVNLTSDMRNSQPFQNAIPEEKNAGETALHNKVHSTPRTNVSSSSQSPDISPIRHEEKARQQKPKKARTPKRYTSNSENIFKIPVCRPKKSK